MVARGRTRSWAWPAFLLGSVLALGGSPGAAQLVTGQVVEEGTGEPIASAMVHLLDSAGARVASIPSDGAGRFTLEAPEVGSYRVEAVRTGFETRRVEGIEVGEARGGRATLGLEHASLQSGEDYYRNQTNLTRGRAQFTERREQGFGFHFDRAAIAALAVEEPAEVFDAVPGLWVNYINRTVWTTMGWQCMQVFFNHYISPMQQTAPDAHRMSAAGLRDLVGVPPAMLRGPDLPSLEYIPVESVEGIEIYRSYREIPDDLKRSLIGTQLWRPDELGGCGIAIIWTAIGW